MFELARRLSFALALVASLATGFGAPGVAIAAPAPYLTLPATESKYAAIVVDANTGEVLYAKRADSPRYPASITKVMTLYLAFEAISEGRLKPTDLITVSARAASQPPTKLGLAAGEQITVDDAMKAIAVKSANDMAVALAEHMGGTEQRFAALMTLRGQELGMSNTRFVNASGLPDSRQISTARDIAIMSRAVMRDFPQYYSFFSLRSFTFRGVTMNNHNRLLGQMWGVDGLKTGYTNASGYNLAASAVRDGRRLIAVVLGGRSTVTRDDHVEDLLLTGFDVMKRRSLGETITVAQSMFEPVIEGPIERPSTEQGDAEQEGLRVVLTDGPPSPTPYTVESRMTSADVVAPRRVATPPKKVAPKKPRGQWAIQAGAFKSKSQAREQLSQLQRRFRQVLDDGEAEIGGAVGGYFRVRFEGMTADAAKAACKALKAKKQPCMVMAP
ncbi:MAG: D-alanyl-D-alanine carboxypeptidase family protein [Caulobacter sp.]|nr:D-alanyl-D-alanine carboxypeptidase family protein [Caulobacter sp.]